MPRSRTFHSPLERRLWWATIAAAAALSAMPTKWLLGWSSDLSGVVNFPLRPFQHVATNVRAWLRPIPDPRSERPEDVQRAERERDEFRARCQRLELERGALEERIARLERSIARSPTGARTRALTATVLSTHAPSGRSAGSLEANVGLRNGVTPGMVATWDIDVVAGMTAEGTGRFSTVIIPVTALTGMQVRFLPPDGAFPVADAASAILMRDGGGGWVADLTQSKPVEEGWMALVDDDRWPMAARGLRIGVVRSIGRRDDAPLHRRIEVTPLVDPFQLPHVELIGDALPEGDGAASEGQAP